MTYLLDEINRQAKTDPKGFIEQSEAAYYARIEETVEDLLKARKRRPILLINGPSSSSKTTTAGLVGKEFERHGVHADVISMDDYYRTRSTYELPRDEHGMEDMESPLCMDLALLSDHLSRLADGEEICVPHFNFEKQSRTEDTTCMRLGADEVAVIEGIHSFNDIVTGPLEEKSHCLYLSVESRVRMSEDEILEPEMLRFMRRAVRDRNFRGYPVSAMVAQWRSVRRGEKLYIAPYRRHAKHAIDTYLPYESCILMNQLQGELAQSEAEMSVSGLALVHRAIGRFATIDYLPHIPESSILHEFIG